MQGYKFKGAIGVSTDESEDILLEPYNSDVCYAVNGYSGVAWRYVGDAVEPDEDTEWTGICNRTGQVVMCMVGDDRWFVFDASDCEPIGDDDYCSECGQIGCTADGR